MIKSTASEVQPPTLCTTEERALVQTRPGPVAEHRVHQGRNDDCNDQVGTEVHALRGRPRHDRNRGATEHDLEQKKGPEHLFTAGKIDEKAGFTEPAAAAGAKHQGEAHSPENNRRQAEIGEVLHRHIDAVLAPGQAALQQQETRLHLEHQGATQDNPQEIDIFLDYLHKTFK